MSRNGTAGLWGSNARRFRPAAAGAEQAVPRWANGTNTA